MTTLMTRLQDLSRALTSEPPDAMRTLRARAWAANTRSGPPLRARVRASTPDDTPLVRASGRLLDRLGSNRLVELRASAPAVARLLDGLRAGPARDAWIRELVEHGSPSLSPAELDRASAVLDREQNTLLGLVLGLAGR